MLGCKVAYDTSTNDRRSHARKRYEDIEWTVAPCCTRRMALNLLLGGLLLALLLGQQLAGAAPVSVLGEALHDAAHLPWFALISLLLIAICRRLWPQRWLPRLLAVLALLAVATELIQWAFAGRVVSLADGGRNLLGAGVALLSYYLVSQRAWYATALVVLLGILLTLWQPVAVVQAKAARVVRLPVLFRAADADSMMLLSANVEVERVATSAGQALLVPVTSVPWPGLRLRDLDQDWRGYEAVVVDLILESPEPVRLIAGARHQGEPPGGATTSTALVVQPGQQRLRFPRAALTPGTAASNRVTELLLYSEAEFIGARWLLLQVALE